ncbi:hypothetical protein GOBAR_DD23537 [Gossypium barbadense]|nr:hypothetical protein GOBAR_DD23537 [Gossypium barbadense]
MEHLLLHCLLDISTSWRKCWHFSNTSWAKINVDGSNSVFQSRAAIGGVIRGPHKGWLVGFGMVTSLVDIFQVEAKAMLEGLKLAWEQGFQQVEV